MIFKPKEEWPYWLRLVVWGIKVGGIILVFFLIYKWINSPVKGTITKPTEKVDSVIVENNDDKHFEGKIISFDYEGEYVLSAEESVLTDGDKQVLYGPSGDTRRIVMMASPTTAMSYDDVSGVKMREIYPDTYEKSEIVVGGVNGFMFKKKTDFERLVVVLNDGKVMTLAMTANSNDEKMDGEFLKMVKSIKWK